MKRRLLAAAVAIVLIAAICLFAVFKIRGPQSGESSRNAVTTTTDNLYLGGKWRHPQNLHLYDLTTTALQASVHRAVDLWNQSAAVQMTYQTATSCPRNGSAICVIEREEGSPSGCWGYSVITISNGVIQPPAQAVMGINAGTHCALDDYPGYRDMLACHEIGHTLGLADSSEWDGTGCESGTVINNGVVTNTSPSQQGYNELVVIYG